MINFLKKKQVLIPYFDLSSREKKKIIKKAALEASKMKRDLIKRYNDSYPPIPK